MVGSVFPLLSPLPVRTCQELPMHGQLGEVQEDLQLEQKGVLALSVKVGGA